MNRQPIIEDDPEPETLDEAIVQLTAEDPYRTQEVPLMLDFVRMIVARWPGLVANAIRENGHTL